MSDARTIIEQCLSAANTRVEFWIRFTQAAHVARMAEVGVFRGDFAAQLLRACSDVQQYYMIDPWRHLDDWNKPANRDDHTFEAFYAETLAKTEFAAARRTVLRGTTTQVIEQIDDKSLDLMYIDGDHTLRGIAIDLIRAFNKVRLGGWIGGDDFSRTIWQHNTAFEPTLVFPFAVYFAEAVGATIYALPYKQFVMHKTADPSFAFVDFTGRYSQTGLRDQFRWSAMWKPKLAEVLPIVSELSKRLRGRG